MLINGLAGSGGDMFPYLFRQMGVGKLIGTRLDTAGDRKIVEQYIASLGTKG